MPGRLMVGQMTLNHLILVRVQAGQQLKIVVRFEGLIRRN